MAKPDDSPPRNPNGMNNDEMTRAIYVRVIGDGTDNNPGIDKRVDRLETKVAIVVWTSGLLVSLAITYFFGLLVAGHHS